MSKIREPFSYLKTSFIHSFIKTNFYETITCYTDSCQHINDCGKKEELVDKLPPATQEGLNTFGCIADGELYGATHDSRTSTDWNCLPKFEIIETGLTGQRITAFGCGGSAFSDIYICIYTIGGGEVLYSRK